MTVVEIGIAIVALGLTTHAVFALSLMLYTWEHPDRLHDAAGPARLRPPYLSFAVLLPARREEAVIAETVRKIWSANYPKELLEVIVICQADDGDTIRAATDAINDLRTPNVRIEVYSVEPFNKPHALKVGLRASSYEVVTVFDAEDDVHPDIFNVINTVMLDEDVGVVQAGVQLMNFRDHWFSIFNCLEYFFYYKSRLHFLAKAGMIPLGGNTVFFRRNLLATVRGWDLDCLTEDADIGIRLSALGERIRVVYDSRWVTREETPNSVPALVRQRTRWHQGFLQVLQKRDWCRLPGRNRRLLAVVTLGQPLLDAVLLCSIPFVPIAALFVKLPVFLALLMCLPLYGVILQMLANVAGAVLLAREYKERLPWWMVARMPLTYLPYQWLLGFSACRATWRHLAGRRDWEKTDHVGAHRAGVPVGAAPAVRGFVMPARRAHAEPSRLPGDRISLVLHDTEERSGSPRSGDRRRDGIRGMTLAEGRKWR